MADRQDLATVTITWYEESTWWPMVWTLGPARWSLNLGKLAIIFEAWWVR